MNAAKRRLIRKSTLSSTDLADIGEESEARGKAAKTALNQDLFPQDQQTPSPSCDSAKLLESLPKKRSVQQMIEDHNRKQEQMEKERKIQRQVEIEQAQQRTVLLRNRSSGGIRSSNIGLSQKSKSKERDRSSSNNPKAPKYDFQALPQLSNTIKASKSGLPLPLLKPQIVKPMGRNHRTTKNKNKINIDWNQVQKRPPTSGSSGVFE